MKALLLFFCIIVFARAATEVPALMASPTHLNFIAAEPVPLSVVSRNKELFLEATIPVVPSNPSLSNIERKARYQPYKLQLSAKGLDTVALNEALANLELVSGASGGTAIKVVIEVAKLRLLGVQQSQGDTNFFTRRPIEFLLLLEVRNVITDSAQVAPNPQLRFVRLRLPPAKLEMPTAYAARQVVPFWDPPTSIAPPLLVRESLGETAIEALTVKDVTRTADPAKVTTAKLELVGPPVKIGTGLAEIKLTTSGTFPLGDYMGSLEFQAPEIVDPVSIPYSLRITRPKEYILWFGTLGLGLGLLLRVGLGYRKGLVEARIPAFELLKRMDEAKKAYSNDMRLFEKISSLEDVLQKATNGAASDAIATAVMETAQAFATELKEYQVSIAAIRQAVADLKFHLSSEWLLPPPARNYCDSISKALGEIEDMAAAGNLSRAEATLTRLLNQMSPHISDTGELWREAFDGLLTDIVPQLPLLPGALARINEAAKKANPFPSTNLSPGMEAKEVTVWLAAWSDSYRIAKRIMELTASHAGRSLANWQVWLKRSTKGQAPATLFESLEKKLNDLLLRAADEPSKAHISIDEWLTEMTAAFRLLVESVPELAVKQELKAKLGERQYEAVVHMVAERLDDQGAKHLGDAPAETVSFLPAEFEMFHLRPRPLAPIPAGTNILVPTAAKVRAQLLGELFLIKSIQTLIAATIYLASVYFGLESTFVGTSRELFTIVFTAFAWDLGFEATLQNAKFK